MLVFEERGKPEYPEKNLSEQSREPTNSAHIWRRVRESNPGHIGGRRALSPLRQPCSPIIRKWPIENCLIRRWHQTWKQFVQNIAWTGCSVCFGVALLLLTTEVRFLMRSLKSLQWKLTRFHYCSFCRKDMQDSDGNQPTDWERYAQEEYDLLVAEEGANEQTEG